jgi:hypothetical protein
MTKKLNTAAICYQAYYYILSTHFQSNTLFQLPGYIYGYSTDTSEPLRLYHEKPMHQIQYILHTLLTKTVMYFITLINKLFKY